MTTQYTMNFTDTANGSFIIQPYTTNGPAAPLSSIPLADSAVTANTSIVFLGKGKFEYGELLQESILHMMEHFSAPTAPVNVIQGQMWFQNDVPQLYIATSSARYDVVGVTTGGSGPGNMWTISGDHTSVFTQNVTFTVTDNPGKGTFTVASSTLVSGNTEIMVNQPIDPSATASGKVNVWMPVLLGGRDVNLLGFKITNAGTPTLAGDLTTKDYVDTNFLSASGGLMIGDLTLTGSSSPMIKMLTTSTVGVPPVIVLYNANNDPLVGGTSGSITPFAKISSRDGTILQVEADTNGNNVAGTAVFTIQASSSLTPTVFNASLPRGDLSLPLATVSNNAHATTKQYVDALGATKVSKSGDTMTGALNMGGFNVTNLPAPVNAGDATSKTYVDTNVATKVSKSGDTMSGSLNMGSFRITNIGTPTDNGDAATKAYVDSVAGSGSVVTSGSMDSLTKTLTLTQSGGPNVDILNVAAGDHVHQTDQIYHLISQAPENSYIREQTITRSTVDSAYPDGIQFNQTVNVLDSAIAAATKILLPRQMFDTTGSASYTISNFDYSVGSNKLMVTVNGVKQYASERGEGVIDLSSPTPNIGSSTGLANGIYTFDMTVNGTPYVVSITVAQPTYSVVGVDPTTNKWTVSGNVDQKFAAGTVFAISGNANVPSNGNYTIVRATPSGANTDLFVVESIPLATTISGSARKPYSMYDLLQDLDANMTFQSIPAVIRFIEGSFVIFSDTVGAGSEVVITAPGTLLSGSGLGASYTVFTSGTSVVADMDYAEIGTPFTSGNTITFHPAAVPIVGQRIEFLLLS